jgi:DNA repair protein RadD
MDERLVSILKKIDLPTIQSLVGVVILKAIKAVNKGEDETAIAEILALKYQNLILSNKEIRTSIINSLPLAEAIRLANQTNSIHEDSFRVYGKLIKYFNTSYNKSKSEILSNFLELGEKYYLSETVDSRCDQERITACHNEETRIVAYLHPYQKRVKDEIMHRLNQNTEKSFFVQMPTGAGKTYTALECVVDLMRKPRELDESLKPIGDKFIVWLVDRNELAEQAMESFNKLWKIRGDHEIYAFRVFKDFEPEFRGQKGGVVFAGFDKFYSILKNPDHKAHQSIKHLINNSELLIIDEAHHSLADTYFACINEFREVPFIKIIGLSATPGSTDLETTSKLVELYSADKISIRNENWEPVSDAIGYLQQSEYLARLSTKLLETGITSNESNEQKILNDLAANAERNQKIIEQIKLADENKESTVVFACSLDHVYALLILCRSMGVDAKYIIGAVDQADRIYILEQFKAKRYNILINLDILSTGIDLPNINKIIIARPISSPNLTSQILGRALRGPKNGGNEQNTIVNIKDNLMNFPGTSFLYNFYQGQWGRIN